jgi:DDE superfamily endonuclease
MWCVPALTPAYLTCMEDVLATYERPYDPQEPVVGLDEKPVPLVADVRPPQPARPGRVARYDYEYSRGGSANVYAVVEPKAGRHFTCATPNRKGAAFAHLLQRLARAYPGARTIHLVMDQLNLHARSSLIRTFGLDAGVQLWNRFHVHYTPVHGSWLNVAEVEVSGVARECIGRRIGDFDTLATRVAAWNRDANRRKRTINWRFTRRKARAKFGYSIRDTLRPRD